VETSNPGLEQISLCTPSGTVHPLCNFSIPKEMADVMEVLLLTSGGDVAVVVVVFLVGTVMDDMGLVRGVSEARRCCACGGFFSFGTDPPELELLLELLVLLILAFLFSFGRRILLGGGVFGRKFCCFCCCCCCFLEEDGGSDPPATATEAETTSFFLFP